MLVICNSLLEIFRGFIKKGPSLTVLKRMQNTRFLYALFYLGLFVLQSSQNVGVH